MDPNNDPYRLPEVSFDHDQYQQTPNYKDLQTANPQVYSTIDLRKYTKNIVYNPQDNDDGLPNVTVLDPIGENESKQLLMRRYQIIKEYFLDHADAERSDFQCLERIRQFFQIEEDEIVSDPAIFNVFIDRVRLIEDLSAAMRDKGLANLNAKDDNDEVYERARVLGNINQLVTWGYQTIAALANFRDSGDPRERPQLPPIPMNVMNSVATDANGKPKQWNERQKYIMFMLDYCQRHRYRKDHLGKGYYREIKNPRGAGTRAWERVGDISELVFRAPQPRSTFLEAWRCQTHSPGLIRSVIEYLSSTHDAEFPKLQKNRRIWAFSNGVYLGTRDTFLEYGDPMLTDSIVACKYFDAPFDNARYVREMETANGMADWRQVNTANIDSILKDQDLESDVRDWFFVLSGRMSFKVKEIDNWQVQMFLKGLAGTGKSTLLNQLIYLWDPTDVGILSNTVERNFPLESLLNVFVYFGLDVSSDLALDQTLWQSMVTGEGIAINMKFKERISIEWEVPGALAGNQTPPWKDNAGSVSRRLLVYAFMNAINEANARPDLNEELRSDIGAFIKKMCCAYGDYGYNQSHKPIWSILPQYFRETRKILRQEISLLDAFLASGECAFGESYMCPMSDFIKQFRMYCTLTKQKPMPQWAPDYYMGIFQQNSPKLIPTKMTNYMYRKSLFEGEHTFIRGVDIKRNLPPELLNSIGSSRQAASNVINEAKNVVLNEVMSTHNQHQQQQPRTQQPGAQQHQQLYAGTRVGSARGGESKETKSASPGVPSSSFQTVPSSGQVGTSTNQYPNNNNNSNSTNNSKHNTMPAVRVNGATASQ